MKDIIISEGRTSKQFLGVSKLHTTLADESGTCSWIPEDEADEYAHLGMKTITSNGTYPAALDGLAGYSSVIVEVPTGAGGAGESMFMDSLETSVLNYVCTPNLVQEGDTISWRDGSTHTFSCTNRSELRGLWVVNHTDLVFKEQHLVIPNDYTSLTSTHIVEYTVNGRPLYFTEIIGGVAPYTNYTFISPVERDPDISSDIAEMYKVYIRKASTEYEKIKFDVTELSGTYNIRLVLGAGSSALSDSGKAIIEKDTNGLAVSYVSRTDDEQRGIYISDDGTYLLDGIDKLPIVAGQYVEELPQTMDERLIYFVPES